MFTYALIAAILVALCSVLGAFIFGTSFISKSIHRYVLPFAIGVFLGVVLIELIPETLELAPERGPFVILVGFLGFYLLSHFLRTYHHHHTDHGDECVGSGAKLLLIGDAIHNVADGVVIASAFLVNPAIGVATTVAIALHEIPQEIAEYGVLVHSGYSRVRAALYNLLSASSIVLGVIALMLIHEHFTEWLFIFIGLAAGNLLYIASADLLPELRSSHAGHFWQAFISTVLGVVLIASVITLAHEYGEEALHGEEGEVAEPH